MGTIFHSCIKQQSKFITKSVFHASCQQHTEVKIDTTTAYYQYGKHGCFILTPNCTCVLSTFLKKSKVPPISTYQHRLSACQFCSVTPIYFLLKNWRPFLVITASLSLFSFQLFTSPLFPACCYVAKNLPLLLWGPFLWGPLFGRTC